MVGSAFPVEPTWTVPLGKPPEVVRTGVGHHGQRRHREFYCMLDVWSLQLYRYEGVFRIGEADIPIRPGDVSLVPPGVPFSYRYPGPSTHLFAHLRIPSSEVTERIPLLQTLAEVTTSHAGAWEAAIDRFASTPQYAEAALWSLLWQLATAAKQATTQPNLHPVVQAALAYIEVHLRETILVPALAEEVGVSHGHLTRLFRSQLHCTVVGYIRRRRTEQALRMLQQTNLPIKAVAESVGIPDLQAFNKAVRKELAKPPRSLRLTPHAGRLPENGASGNTRHPDVAPRRRNDRVEKPDGTDSARRIKSVADEADPLSH